MTQSSFKLHGSGIAIKGSIGNFGLKTSDTRGLDGPLDRGLDVAREDDEGNEDKEAIREEMKDGGQEPTLSGLSDPKLGSVSKIRRSL
jgi:hypothetical protein